MRVNRIWWLLFSIVACDKPDRNSLIACPRWAGSACASTGSATVAPQAGSGSDDMGRLERAAAAIAQKPATKHRASGGGGGGGRSTTAATVPPDAPPARKRGLANGVACTFSSDCASGECDYGACASEGGDKKLGNGVACTFSSDCASGECTYGACASNSGSKELGTGVACTFDSDCKRRAALHLLQVRRRLTATIAIVTFVVLVLELTSTRLFAYIGSSHATSTALSIALLGLGVGAAVRVRWPRAIEWAALGLAAALWILAAVDDRRRAVAPGRS